MFLASVFPISERSSVNLNGKVNTANITIFADEEAYIHDMAAVSASQAMIAQRDELANTILNLTKPETTSTATTTSTVSDKKDDSIKDDYSVYKIFWNLQSYFCMDGKTMEIEYGLTATASAPTTTTTTKTVAAPSVKDTKNSKSTSTTAASTSAATTTTNPIAELRTPSWLNFTSHIDKIIELFQTHSFSVTEKAQAKEKSIQVLKECFLQHKHKRELQLFMSTTDTTNNTKNTAATSNNLLINQNKSLSSNRNSNNNTSIDEEYMGCKYLTFPPLFQLQLGDPSVRQELLTQILLYLHNLSYKLQFIAESAVATAATGSPSAGSVNIISLKSKVKPSTAVPAVTTTASKTSVSNASASSTSINNSTNRNSSNSNTTASTNGTSTTKTTTSTSVPPNPTSASTSVPLNLSHMTPLEQLITYMYHDIHRMKTQILTLMKDIPPNGEEFVLFFTQLLQREKKWIFWKNKSCPEFERSPTLNIPPSHSINNISTVPNSTLGVKRKLDAADSNNTTTTRSLISICKNAKSYVCDLSMSTVARNSLEIVATVPSFEQHLAVSYY